MSKSKYILLILLVAFCLAQVDAQKQKSKRPARKAKVQDTRVYLVHADLLHYDEKINPDATEQLVRGFRKCEDVSGRHALAGE